MNINSIANFEPTQTEAVKPKQTVGEAQQSFANSFKDAIENINHSQVSSDKKTEALAKGEIDDLHDVMITAQKASITLQTGVQVQKKMVDAYNEVMRMQV